MAKKHTSLIRAKFADAEQEIKREVKYISQAAHLERDGIKPGDWDGFPFDNMPPNCPISVHGHKMGIIYVTDAAGQLVALERGEQNNLVKLFGRYQDYMNWAFPKKKAKAFMKDANEEPLKYADKSLIPIITGLEVIKLYQCLIAEGDRQGLFDPAKQHRGRGGWLDSDDKFVWHSGEYLYVEEKGKLKCAEPTKYKGYLYTVQPRILTPYPEPVAREESPAHRLLEDFATWNWDRPYLDPILLVGWIVTALMGGALPWRPIIFTTGGAGVGKSTLHAIIQGVLGDAVMATADTTAAGIYQNIKQDSTAVIVDEFEAAANMAKRQPVIDLARIASSGASMYRGGADHQGTSFEVRCSFMFSAINVPPLGSADKSRMVVLNLGQLDKRKAVGKEFIYGADMGRKLLRQVIEYNENFRKTIFPYYQTALHEAGFNQRQIDTYGTLLAAAEMALGHEAIEAFGLPVSDKRQLGDIVSVATKDERAAQKPNWQICLDYLLESTIDSYKGGEKPTIGGLLDFLQELQQPAGADHDNTRAALLSAGLAYKQRGKVEGAQGLVLCIPANSEALNKLCANSEFQAGGWYGPLKQGPKQFILRSANDRPGLNKNSFKVRIGLTAKHCILVDLKAYQEWVENDGEIEDG